MSKNRIAALGAGAAAALASSVLLAPAAVAQQDEGPYPSPSAYAIQATGLLDNRISYVDGTGKAALADIAVPEDDPFIHAKVAPAVSKPGYAHAEIISLTLGRGDLSLTLKGITATCDDGELSSALAKIIYNGEVQAVDVEPNTEVIPDPLNELIDIDLNTHIPRDDGSKTVKAVTITLLGGLDEMLGDAPLLGDVAGQTITLSSATCSNVPGDDKPEDDGDKPDDGDTDEAEEDGTAPTPVPSPGHISVTG